MDVFLLDVPYLSAGNGIPTLGKENIPPDDIPRIACIILAWEEEDLVAPLCLLSTLQVRPEEVSVWVLHDPPSVEKGAGWIDVVVRADARRDGKRFVLMGEFEVKEERFREDFAKLAERNGFFQVMIGRKKGRQYVGLPQYWAVTLSSFQEIAAGSPPPKEIIEGKSDA